MSANTEYKVKKGDTLSSIARMYGTTYQEIAKANGIKNPDLIYEGQVLKIGGTNPTSTTPTSTTTPTTPTTAPTTTPTTESDVPTVGNPTTPPPATNTPASGYTYEAFAPSDETIAAGNRRNEVYAQKPGEFTYDPYAKDDIVLQAETQLQQWLAGKPGEYQSVWEDEADAYRTQYENRDPFSYDFNSDALYNQYKDQYIQQGQMAMMDAMAQAAALSGGYGNSYAQTAGQMAYNQQLNQLNNIMPELYAMARDQYNQEGQKLLDMYNLYMDREKQEYGKYQDNLDNWYKHLDYLTEDARIKGETDYNRWMDDTNMGYKLWQDGYNSWLDEYNLLDENYWNLYGRDYETWSDKTGMDFDNYWKNTEMDYNKEQDAKAEKNTNWNKLADLITNTGYVPTAAEREAAGMTETEATAMKNAYTASVSKPEDETYITPSLADRDMMEKSVSRVTSIAKLQSLTKQYLAMGYDPNFINELTSAKAAELIGEVEPKDPSEVDPMADVRSQRRNGGRSLSTRGPSVVVRELK